MRLYETDYFLLSHHCSQSKAKLCSEEAPALTFEADSGNWKNADRVGDILNPNGSIMFELKNGPCVCVKSHLLPRGRVIRRQCGSPKVHEVHKGRHTC